MHEAAVTPAWVLLAYLISGVCFILALRGLSSPESSRRGNRAGMIGMAIAVATTLLVHGPRGGIDPGLAQDVGYQATAFLEIRWAVLGEILAAIAIGAAIG